MTTIVQQVLDQGYVSLIESWGSDERIIEAARMSTNKGFQGWDTDAKLLAYLWNNKHATPFEMAGMIIEVKAPIFVFREWHRHRTQCLSGSTQIIFTSRGSGAALPMQLKELVRKWNPPESTRKVVNRSLMLWKRERLGSMLVRSPTGPVNITDAWFSGEKPVYRLTTKYGDIVASADHLMKTPEGSAKVSESPKHVMAMIQMGHPKKQTQVCLTEKELSTEKWREVSRGYEVSNLGRVRSYLKPGHTKTTPLRKEPRLKKITIGKGGRPVVNMDGQVVQVSKLVASAFLGAVEGCQVLHKDDNSLDNRKQNLYLGSALDNAADRKRNRGQKYLHEVPVEVLKISKAGIEETFDISVSGNHWFVANNLVVHNSYNEMSARYTPLPDENYVPSVERLMMQGGANKQAQSAGASLNEIDASTFIKALKQSYLLAQTTYELGLKFGVPKELARLPVPVARYSKMRAGANLRNWLAFLTLRMAPNAQWEIRQYANAVGTFIEHLFPRTWQLFNQENSHAGK